MDNYRLVQLHPALKDPIEIVAIFKADEKILYILSFCPNEQNSKDQMKKIIFSFRATCLLKHHFTRVFLLKGIEIIHRMNKSQHLPLDAPGAHFIFKQA